MLPEALEAFHILLRDVAWMTQNDTEDAGVKLPQYTAARGMMKVERLAVLLLLTVAFPAG